MKHKLSRTHAVLFLFVVIVLAVVIGLPTAVDGIASTAAFSDADTGASSVAGLSPDGAGERGLSGEGEEKSGHGVMRFSNEDLLTWIEDYNAAPGAYIDEEIARQLAQSPNGSVNLLNHLEYTPSERDQGHCGNCWAWASTGVMEIALDVQEGVKDRLSIQYLNSNYNGGSGSSWACCGGNLEKFANFYTGTGEAIPWSNTNADWQDDHLFCEDEPTSVPAGTISTTPFYPITSINDGTIDTHFADEATAISNIKNVLHQNKAVVFSYFLPTGSDWANFDNFWDYDTESAIWNPDYSCGHTWEEGQGAGHGVLCIGYNDEEGTENDYWLMLNSWGTTADRPNGLFRLDMHMDYDCQYFYYYDRWSFYWQTIDITFGEVPTPTPSPSPTPPPPSTELGGALDNTDLEWTTGGDADWLGQTEVCYYGGDAAQSGDINHNQETWLRTSVSGSGTFTFWWKVSSEPNYDLLEFTLDDAGSPTTSISGNKDWRQVGVAIYGSGAHSLEWKYIKDVTRSLGEDTGWVDRVEWSPGPTPSPTPSGTPVPTPTPSPTPGGTPEPSPSPMPTPSPTPMPTPTPTPSPGGTGWSVPMMADTAAEGSNPNLFFGTDEAATGGFDSGIDIPHPQPPTVFDAYFSISDGLFPRLDRDYRAPGDTIAWSLHVVSNPEDIELVWDAGAVPEDVPLWMTGTGVQVDMKDVNNTVLLPAGAHDLTISTEPPAPCGTVPLDEGWSLISLPLIPDDTDIETVLADVSSNVIIVWHYDAGTATWLSWAPFWGGNLLEMEDGKGYWIHMNAADTLVVEGVELPLPPQVPPTYPVYEGWNLIGFKSCTPRTASDYLAAIVGKWTVMYDGQGQHVLLGDYMEPGCGYWLAANASGTIYP